MPIADLLWGGQLKTITFDPVDHDRLLRIEITDGDSAKQYCLVCREISELHFANSIPEPWDYAEVTEVHAEPVDEDRWSLEILLWSEDCRLTCVCDEFDIVESA